MGYIKSTYTSTTERLGPLLEKHQITYDLLWTLFKPNTLAHTKCFGTGQPRCVRYEFGEEKTTNGGVEYFHIKARYLDFDGKVFGEALSKHAIEKFRGAKRITALEVFPLKFHPSEKNVRAHLTKCGQKFLSMMDIHLCEYEGKAFYIEKEKVVEIFINSRVVVDAAYFREENPNYARPSIKESDEGSGWIYIDLDDVSEKSSSSSAKANGMDPSEVKGDDLLICSPTVPGFSLGNRRWGEHAILFCSHNKFSSANSLIQRSWLSPIWKRLTGNKRRWTTFTFPQRRRRSCKLFPKPMSSVPRPIPLTMS
jgi:hypothetical protein